MNNENLDTTNKLIKPEDVSPSDDEVIRQLSNNLQDITPEDVDAMCDVMNEAEKRKEEEKKKWEIPQELKDFRKKWEEKIDLDEDKKKVIIEAAKSIPVKVETESDGSRLIEFKLGDKTYKILDPKLKTHSDDEYFVNSENTYIRKRDERVKLGGMKGDDINQWKNKKLAKYVKEKKKEGLHIAKIEEMKAILTEIGESAGLDGESDQIAMLMYLTGMDGWYWLSMGDDETSGNQGSRSALLCDDDSRYFYYDYSDYSFASLCMIACEGDDEENGQPKTEDDRMKDMIDFFNRVNNDSGNIYR